VTSQREVLDELDVGPARRGGDCDGVGNPPLRWVAKDGDPVRALDGDTCDGRLGGVARLEGGNHHAALTSVPSGSSA
jgi:hypothetical protein